MAKIGEIRTDTGLESEGVWRTYRDTDLRVKIARVGNPAFEAEARKLRKDASLKAKASGGQLTEADAKLALVPAVAKHIIKGWENLEDDDGQPLEYSTQACVDLLSKPELHDFYDWVMTQGAMQDNFRAAALEESSGN